MPLSTDIPVFSSEFASVVRRGRHVLATLHEPAHVLSTCARNGGLRSDLRYLINHQSCEGAKHHERADFIHQLGPAEYQQHVCDELAIDHAHAAVMGTAANMQYLGLCTRTWADLSVTAIVTAGVSGNAGCAGDPANYDETNGKWERVTEPGTSNAKRETRNPEPAMLKPAGTQHGTINTMLLLSSPLTAAALSRAVVTMTEAKTSALVELAVGSKYSRRAATGTGTDQYAIASPQDGSILRSWTGHHTKAGELIGDAVRTATLEALRWQNGLEASYTRSLFHALGRFGVKEAELKTALANQLPARDNELLAANWQAVIHEPQVSAAVYAFAAVLDRALYGTLGASVAHEALLNQAALIAASLAARPEAFVDVRRELANTVALTAVSSPEDLVTATPILITRALASGWSLKWKS